MIQEVKLKIIPRFGGCIGLFLLVGGLEEFQLAGAEDGLAPVGNAQLLEDMLEMDLDRLS